MTQIDKPGGRPRGYQALFAELKRRHVFEVLAVYGGLAFVRLQVADLIFRTPIWRSWMSLES